MPVAKRNATTSYLVMSGRPSQVRPGEKHRHGTTATTAMSHIAIQDLLDGQAVAWPEAVSDDQYRSRMS